jgi:hypothetical protein
MTIRIEGVDELIRKLGKVEGVRVLRAPMEESVSLIQNEMMIEPPAIPGSLYRRGFGMANSRGIVRRKTSEQLSKHWTRKVKASPNGVMGIVGTNVTYAPWVQSHQFQARIHRGRWGTDRKAIEKHRDEIVERFRRAIHNALARG